MESGNVFHIFTTILLLEILEYNYSEYFSFASLHSFMSDWGLLIASLFLLSEAAAITSFSFTWLCLLARQLVYNKVVPELKFTKSTIGT